MKEQKNQRIKPDPILGDPPKLADKIVIVKGGIMGSNPNTIVPLFNVSAEVLTMVFTNWQSQPGYPAVPREETKEGLFSLTSNSGAGSIYEGNLAYDDNIIESPNGHAYNVDIIFVYEGKEHTLRNANVELVDE